MYATRMDILMFEETVKAGNVLPLAISLLATVLLFVLARLAFFLYRAGDLTISCRRLAELDPCMVRLDLIMENHKKAERTLQGLYIARYEGNQLVPLAMLTKDPIQRLGDSDFIEKKDRDYIFHLLPGKKNEAIVEFDLIESAPEIYLVATNKKGKCVKARLNLNDTNAQVLEFHRA